jgi:hypothetical protein
MKAATRRLWQRVTRAASRLAGESDGVALVWIVSREGEGPVSDLYLVDQVGGTLCFHEVRRDRVGPDDTGRVFRDQEALGRIRYWRGMLLGVEGAQE